MRRWLALILVAGVGCSPNSSPTTPSAPSPPPSSPAPIPTYSAAQVAAAVTFCFEETNRLRSRVGAAPVQRASDQESHAMAAARADHLANDAHRYSRGIPNRTWWENEVLRANHVTHPNLNSFVSLAIDLFWREGPGGPHYETLIGPFRAFGCGLYVEGTLATLVQQFRP